MKTSITFLSLFLIVSLTSLLQASGVYVVETGIAYRWFGNNNSDSNSNRVAAPELNDGNLINDIRLSGSWGENNPNPGLGWYQAAGLIFSTTKTITKVEFVNGSFAGQVNGVWDDGCFEEDFKLQTTVDGTTWTDATEWTLSPAYEYMNTSVSGATFTFTGSATDILGVRVTGKVRMSEDTGSWDVRAAEIAAYSGGSTDVPNSQKESSIFIYSNQSKSKLTVANIQSNNTIKVVSINGSIVSEVLAKSETVEFEVSNWAKGVYIVYIETGTNTVVRKAIIQ